MAELNGARMSSARGPAPAGSGIGRRERCLHPWNHDDKRRHNEDDRNDRARAFALSSARRPGQVDVSIS
jgi:hypothetical protein